MGRLAFRISILIESYRASVEPSIPIYIFIHTLPLPDLYSIQPIDSSNAKYPCTERFHHIISSDEPA